MFNPKLNPMKIKKVLFFLSILFVSIAFTSSSVDAEWIENFEEAKENAELEGKVILMSFRGSDWCANCRRMEKVLFDSDEFVAYAKDNLILLKVDFPMKKENRLTKEQQKYNDGLAEKFNPEGKFPKVILFKSTGEKIGDMDGGMNTVQAYLTSIKAIVNG